MILSRVLGISRQRIFSIRVSLKKEKDNQMKQSKVNKEEDEKILVIIRQIVGQMPIYGHRKVRAILRMRHGKAVSGKRVYRIMKGAGLCMPASHSHKSLFKGIPFSYKLEAQRPDQLWGIDMTYIWCGADGWGYFHGVIDHFDKTLLGYTFSRSCKAQGAVLAMAEATMNRIPKDLELRSDNGCHYGAKVFRDELRRLGINHTRTMVNTPKGNAIIERFFRSLKEECVWQHQFKNFDEAKKFVDEWVVKYNQERPHQSLGYLTPAEFFNKNVRTAA